MRRWLSIVAWGAVAGCAHAPPEGPFHNVFRVFAADDAGGGWVLQHRPADGDTIWGCADTSSLPSCTQLFLDTWHVGTRADLLHVTDTTQRAWLRLRTNGYADTLLACEDPEGSPSCRPVQLPLAPGNGRLERVWPPLRETSDDGVPLAEDDPRRVMEPASRATMWVSLGPARPGALNLYACTGLDTEPVCQVAAPGVELAFREDLGLRRVEPALPGRGLDAGVRLLRVAEGSAAWDAGLREGMVVVALAGHAALSEAQLHDLLAQVPAGRTVDVVTEDGARFSLTPRLRQGEKKRRARR